MGRETNAQIIGKKNLLFTGNVGCDGIKREDVQKKLFALKVNLFKFGSVRVEIVHVTYSPLHRILGITT